MGERITYATCMLINELEFYHVCLEKHNREFLKNYESNNAFTTTLKKSSAFYS